MNLNNMTVTELRKLAARHNVTGRSTMKKAELIAALSAPEIADLVELTVTVDQMDDTVTSEVTEVVEFSAAKDEPVELDNRVRIDITRYDQGKADARMNDRQGFEYWAQVVRQGRRWVLIDSCNGEKNFTIRAGSLGKLAKRWAAKLDNWADDIRVVREF